MNAFPAGLVVKLTLPLIDDNGRPVTPTTLAFSVSDLDDTVLVPKTNIDFASNDTDAEITVPASANLLAAGETTSGRTIQLYIGSADGVHVRQETYALRAYQRLVPPRNSFVTDAQAQVLALDMLGLEALTNASATDRQAALIEAHTRIARIPLTSVPATNRRCASDVGPESWPGITVEAFRALPVEFKKALFRAQLREADALLAPDTLAGKRRAGILSETIGESSITFQAGSVGRAGLASSEALSELTGYIVRSYTIVRA